MSKSHLVIGLGGTGGRVLRALRKTLYEEYREQYEKIPGIHLGFLHIDSSDELMVPNDPSWRVIGKNVQLDPSDQILIKNRDLKAILKNKDNYPNIKNWIGDAKEWGDVLNSMVGSAVGGQKRRLGRFLLAANSSAFSVAINNKTRQLKTASGRDEITFHIIAGLAGGTGSGIVVDVCAQLRKLFKEGATASRFRILVYCLLPEEIPKENWDTGNYHANGYACLCELNALSTGNYLPYDVIDQGNRLVATQDPFSGCYVFCNTNENGITVNVEDDAPGIMADFIYQKTVAAKDYNWEMLNRMENAENNDPSAETGIDGITPERSTRFLTFGMKRLVIPNKEISEFLTYKFALAAVEQIRFNNWSQEQGYLSEPSAAIPLSFVREAYLEERWKITEGHLTLCKALGDETNQQVGQEHRVYWAAIINRLTEAARREPSDRFSGELQRLAKEQFDNRFRGTMGVTQFFEISKREAPRHSNSIIRAFEKYIFDEWRTSSLSMLQVIQLTEQFTEYLRERQKFAESEMERLPKEIVTIEEKIRNIQREHSDLKLWDRILGREGQLQTQLSVALKDYYSQRTYFAAWDFARTLLQETVLKMLELREEIQQFADRFENGHLRFDYNAKNRCNDTYSADAITDDVFRLQAVKFYYPENVHKEVQKLLRDEHLQNTMASEIRAVMTDGIASDHPFGALNQRNTEQQVLERIEEICLKHAKRAIESLGGDDNNKLLNVNIIERLAARYSGDIENLRKLVRKLIEHSGNYIVINQDEAPKSGQMTKGANQQTSHFAVIVPRTPNRVAFLEELRQAFVNEKPSGAPTIEFIETDAKPYEIALVQITNLFPLRYVQQVASLREKYYAKLNGPEKARKVMEIHGEDQAVHLDQLYLMSREEQLNRIWRMREAVIPYLMLGMTYQVIEDFPDRDLVPRQMIVERSSLGIMATHPIGRNLRETYEIIEHVDIELLRRLVTEKLAEKRLTFPETKSMEAKLGQILIKFKQDNSLQDHDSLAIKFTNASLKAIELLPKL